ncbi:L-aminoadipate-semialdehyde dehydrogenase-phosphopantetheinyl transferase [Toxorhynchites rutilus septentrionalis]|uniref:L-aminoadipate-semialdehyde dehydrogenase-phosphopantetheinyl transferase n=1 Tax=Toxorhynchites rutilus septentrionalis TaxID=329112 RepID=UPI00247AD48C|nr:L-aminoadipate-semialdehyde dehydrogenase-phosphopantetheinyl transferase [Toxorhynchites rutilus septentrionalis]
MRSNGAMHIRSNGHARWAFDLSSWQPSWTELLLATSCVQPDEKRRLAKFVFRDDVHASLIGRLMMRRFVHLATGLEYDRIEFDRDGKGKPFLKNPGFAVNFNVSHQGRYCVLAGLAGASDRQLPRIGVDVMKIEYAGGRPLWDFFRLMDRNFSEEEWMYIRSHQSESEQLEAFIRNWCLKESYVKNVGVGIAVDLRKISFKIGTKVLDTEKVIYDSTLRLNDELLKDWRFEESLIDKDHCVAVAFEHMHDGVDLSENCFETVGFEALVEAHKPLLAIDENYCEDIISKEYKTKK